MLISFNSITATIQFHRPDIPLATDKIDIKTAIPLNPPHNFFPGILSFLSIFLYDVLIDIFYSPHLYQALAGVFPDLSVHYLSLIFPFTIFFSQIQLEKKLLQVCIIQSIFHVFIIHRKLLEKCC